MGIESEVNSSSDAAPYGGKSVFSQTEHNIVAGYLITAGKQEKIACSVWFLMQTYNTAYCDLKQISVIRDFSEKKYQMKFYSEFLPTIRLFSPLL